MMLAPNFIWIVGWSQQAWEEERIEGVAALTAVLAVDGHLTSLDLSGNTLGPCMNQEGSTT